jgi:hypothetical protein
MDQGFADEAVVVVKLEAYEKTATSLRRKLSEDEFGRIQGEGRNM